MFSSVPSTQLSYLYECLWKDLKQLANTFRQPQVEAIIDGVLVMIQQDRGILQHHTYIIFLCVQSIYIYILSHHEIYRPILVVILGVTHGAF